MDPSNEVVLAMGERCDPEVIIWWLVCKALDNDKCKHSVQKGILAIFPKCNHYFKEQFAVINLKTVYFIFSLI